MRLPYLTIAILIAAAVAAQGRAATAPTGAGRSAAVNVSRAQAAIDRAAAANKYVFLFFWKEKGPATEKAWAALQPAIAKVADTARAVSIRVTDPAEKKLVDKYGVSHGPMPLVLAVAPCGAITKAFAKTFDEKELRTAFVSPCTLRCLQALQSRKLVFVCLVDQANLQDKMPVPKGVEDFKADKKYGAATEIIMVNVRNAKEGTFLKGVGLGAHDAPMTMFLAPPGAVIGTFTRRASKEMFTAQLVAAQSGCGAGCSCHH
ncbi:MAG: hypothetical protein WCB27_10080 [Thermoguttaceae bacterium]|jgi:hypothetical protein